MKNQNLVFTVLFVQTILLVWLAFKLTGLQNQVTNLTPVNTAQKQSQNSQAIQAEPQPLSVSGLTASEVRAVIRSELDLFVDDILVPYQQGLPNAEPRSTEPKYKDGELETIQNAVNTQLSLLQTGSGNSPVEIARLEQNIARLPKGEREAAVRQLFKAINQNKVDVKF